MWRTITYYMQRTGIPVNFGITVLLGFIIGAAIAGQTFYLFTLDNLKQFGALKAMGVTQPADRRHGADAGAGGRRPRLRDRRRPGGGRWRKSLMARIKGVPPAMFMAWPIPVGTAVAAAADRDGVGAGQPAPRADAGAGVGVSMRVVA